MPPTARMLEKLDILSSCDTPTIVETVTKDGEIVYTLAALFIDKDGARMYPIAILDNSDLTETLVQPDGLAVQER